MRSIVETWRRRALSGLAGSVSLLALALACPPAQAADQCTHEQLGAAVDQAGEQLRKLTAATQPVLQAKMAKLKEIKGWSDSEYQDKGYAALEDERTAKLDSAANELLARIDQLGGDNGAAAPECSRVAEVEAVSLELQATVKAKGQYVLARLDQLIGEKPVKSEANTASAAPPAAPVPPVAAIPPPAPQPPPPAQQSAPPKQTAAVQPPPAAKAPPPKADPRWNTQTKSTPPPAAQAPPVPSPPAAVASVTSQPPPSAPPPERPAEGFAIDEIVDASRGLFGKVSANLGRVLEHAFEKSGRPEGYILGQETGGAFVAGLRYGQGTLYMRNGETMPVYWHGPSLGADVGAQGASTLFLIYKIRQPSELFSNFSGLEGSAFVVGGLGMTYMTNGTIEMAPIRSGIGLRIGANLGYIRFTSKPTWNPF